MMAEDEEVMMTTMTIAVIVGNLKPAVEHPKLQFLPEHHRTRETLQVVAMVVTKAMAGTHPGAGNFITLRPTRNYPPGLQGLRRTNLGFITPGSKNATWSRHGKPPHK